MMKRYVLDARTANNHFPGIGRYVSQLAQAMSKQLLSDEQLILFHDPTQPSQWQLPMPSDKVRWVETAVSPFSLWQQWQIPRFLRQCQADIYHSPYYLMPYWLNLPIIVTIHDLTPQLFSQYVPMPVRFLFRLTTHLALRQSAHVIAVSESTKRDLERYYLFPSQQATAVYHAPGPCFQPQTTKEIARLRQQYNLPENYVLYLGINKPHKNLVQLLNAWQMLKEKTADSCLVIAGAWDERYPEAKLQAERLQLGQLVRFLGPIANADLPALYAGATLFVFPSRYEGFGLPVVEAMACGTAVVCAHTSSLPEVGGEAVLYFEPDDVEAMAKQISRLLKDEPLRQQLEQAGLIQARQFSWSETALATLNVYRHVSRY